MKSKNNHALLLFLFLGSSLIRRFFQIIHSKATKQVYPAGLVIDSLWGAMLSPPNKECLYNTNPSKYKFILWMLPLQIIFNYQNIYNATTKKIESLQVSPNPFLIRV